MPSSTSPQQRQAGKRQIVSLVEQGASVKLARSQCEVPMHRSTVYRLLSRVQSKGEAGYTDGRHGHPIKLRGEVRAFLIECCQATSSLSGPQLQRLIQERFAVRLSVSQINRVRASLGLTYQPERREKKLCQSQGE
jgi:transposase